jgi:phage gpG-like protein
MIEFTFDLNPQPLNDALAAFQASLADQSPVLGRIADDFRELIAEQFASEGRAGGTPWAELAPSTLRRKRGAAISILYETGALLRSLTDPGSADHLEESDGQSLTLGSRLPYALFHQTGTGWGFGRTGQMAGQQKGRGTPMRPLIVVSPERSDAWVEMFRQALEEKTLLLGTQELSSA